MKLFNAMWVGLAAFAVFVMLLLIYGYYQDAHYYKGLYEKNNKAVNQCLNSLDDCSMGLDICVSFVNNGGSLVNK